MAVYIGIDGTPVGWVAVYLDDEGHQDFSGGRYADELLKYTYERATIDIPVGLPLRGYRKCDVRARELVGPRVFLGARWGVWSFRSYTAANLSYWGAAEKGISLQLWCIREKLEEINTQMTPARQETLLECHPELVFWRLAGRVLSTKTSKLGRTQRIDLLNRSGIHQIEHWLGKRRGSGASQDDLIDAAACALAARHRSRKLPEDEEEIGHRDIRMEIWY
jgi:predicted RNase H-like nuclease